MLSTESSCNICRKSQQCGIQHFNQMYYLNVLLQSTPAIQEENNIISPSLTVKIRKFQKYELLSFIRYTLYVINSYVVLCTSQENNLNSNKDNKFDVDWFSKVVQRTLSRRSALSTFIPK